MTIALIAGLAAMAVVLGLYFTFRGGKGDGQVGDTPGETIDAALLRPQPLDTFDLRRVGDGSTRIKMWVTPQAARAAYGLEFVCRDAAVSTSISRRGAAGHTLVPMSERWVDLVNEAIRGESENSPEATARRQAVGVTAEMVVERSGEVPDSYELRFDPEGPAWTVLDEMISHYGVRTYVVQRGDKVETIAAKLYGDARRAREILEMNPGLEPRRMRPGQTIHVPAK